MTKVFIRPKFRGVDDGSHGGIRRVVDAQLEYLPQFGYEITEDINQADIVAMHAGVYAEPDKNQLAVAHCHGLYWRDYEWPKWAKELNNEVIKVLKVADLITAPTEWVANAIRRGMWADVHVVPHGVDTETFKPRPSNAHDNYVLWNKSRADAVCDPDAVVHLARSEPTAQFVATVGPKDNLPHNLRITGLLPYADSAALVQAAGVYLCTARETFGIGTLEAMACGVPVLGWAWGGQAEMLEHKVHGWLAKPGDFDSLREGLRYCLQYRDELGAACRELALTYTWESAIKQYADLYDSALRFKSASGVRISVVMPSYNLSKYLDEAINSVLRQVTVPSLNFELVIVDDNSTDDSYSKAMAWAARDTRVRVLRTPTNLYLAGALNYGIDNSKGEYILPLDADNILPENTLNLLGSILDNDRSLDIVYGRVKFVVEDGRPDRTVAGDGISRWPPRYFNWPEQLSHKNQIPSTSMYRKRVWSRIGGYRRRCKTAEDADFWCRATSFGFTAKQVTEAVTLIYRNREESMSHVEKDWPWEAWYPFLSSPPMGACIYAAGADVKVDIATCDPIHVSVIIPVGPHHGEILVDALDSVYAQSMKNWECIVVNDSGQYIKNLPSWVRLLATKGGQGVSVARNLGLQAAKGVCVFFLDADDYIDHDALLKMWGVYRQHGGYVYSDFINTKTDQHVKVPDEACGRVVEMLPHPITGLYPRKSGVAFDESMRVGEDWDFVCAMNAAGFCGTRVPEPLLYYRNRTGGNRVSLLENMDEIRPLIKEKWGAKMGCGCSQGGNGKVSAALQTSERSMAMAATHAENADLILIEYVQEAAQNKPYRGRITGQMYKFDSRKPRYVHRADAEAFITELGHLFRLVNTNDLVGASR